MPVLMVKLAQINRAFPLPEGMPVFIGRAKECDIHLTTPGVSRRHAVVVFKDGVCGIKDLGSFNGTFVNGRAVTQPCELADGDIIKISGFTLRYVHAAAPVVQEPMEEQTPSSSPTGVRERPSSTLRLPRAMTEKASVQHLFTHIKHNQQRGQSGEDTRIMPNDAEETRNQSGQYLDNPTEPYNEVPLPPDE